MTTSETGPRAAAVPREILAAVAAGAHHDPHGVLGAHVGPDGVTVRTLKPFARSVTVVTEDDRVEAHHEHDGIWAAALPGTQVRDYRLEVVYDTNEGQAVHTVDDPYRYLPVARRGRPAPDPRGPPRAAVDRARRARAPLRRPAGHEPPARASRCGRRTPAPSASSATSTPGTAAPTPCARSAAPASGSCSCPGMVGGARYKFELLGKRRPLAPEGRPDGPRHRGPAVDRVGRHRVLLHLGRRGVAGRAGRARTSTTRR